MTEIITDGLPSLAVEAVGTPVVYTSGLRVLSIDDILGTFGGVTYADDPSLIDTDGSSGAETYTDKAGNTLYPIDSEFGFYVTDFVGAETKILDGDYAEGFAGNVLDDEGNVIGISLHNAETDIFKSGAPLGTWALGLGGATVKASTEHYNVMAQVLSDQAFPGDPDAVAPLDDDLKLRDLRPTGTDGAWEPGVLHELYVSELTDALETAVADVDGGAAPQTYADIDFDRDGTLDTYTTMAVSLDYDTDGDGTPEAILVGGVDLDADGEADVVDSWLNGFGTIDVTDLLEPNESTINYDIAYGDDYSVTLKDDGKLLYRWGTAVKRPNDIRMDVEIDLPEEWTRDLDNNGIADSLENGHAGFRVISAQLLVTHDITNNPNDQIRPEDYENEAAIGRLPSYYEVTDPDDAANTLWVAVRDSYNGEGEPLPSYLKLDASGEVDMTAGGTAVYFPDGTLAGYRNEDASGVIGAVFRDLSLIAAADGMDAASEDLTEGFTADWYTTVDREPFEWSYDLYPADDYRQVFVSFHSREEAEAEGFTDDALVSGPRWRLTPNKFGQDLPGLEVPLEENTPPPYQRDNIKYETGELITTSINLLDWEGDSPLSTSHGFMLIDPTRLDENGDGIIDAGWSAVNGTLGEGDALPTGLILTAVTPNGQMLRPDTLDTAVYLKGDRQDSTSIYDMQLVIEYESIEPPATMGAVQTIDALTHVDQTVSFEGGAEFLNPVVFATVTSMNGRAPVTAEFSEITSTGATLHLEEPDYLDGWHAAESVTLLTLEEGAWRLADGTMLEVGTTVIPEGPTDTFYSVSFEATFDEAPTVLLQVQTANGPQWEIVRARNITTEGFEIALQEEQANNEGGSHTMEVVGWAAIDVAGADDVFEWNGLGAQAFSSNSVTDFGDAFSFDEAVGTDPLISAGLTSYNGADPANLRIADVIDDGTNATALWFAQEDQSADAETSHWPETASGLAFETAGLLTATEVFLDTLVVG
ncbi:H-type lectin domain-containing protein [Rhodovulum sp. DZ06]|uniref:H-type lectin domain-containing protein n=1 Tax=Rhodovulum sp. DZ06 TaxID=3425126 RepID=UPI003D32BF30